MGRSYTVYMQIKCGDYVLSSTGCKNPDWCKNTPVFLYMAYELRLRALKERRKTRIFFFCVSSLPTGAINIDHTLSPQSSPRTRETFKDKVV